MRAELFITLNQEIKLLDSEILKLNGKKDSISKLIEVYNNPDAMDDSLFKIDESKVEAPTPRKAAVKSKAIRQGKVSDNGKQKVSQFLMDIFRKNPNKSFFPNQLVEKLRYGIEGGICNETKKDIVSCVSAYIWNFHQRGVITRSKEADENKHHSYHLTSVEVKPTSEAKKPVKNTPAKRKAATESAELEGLSKFDELLSDLIYKESPITSGALAASIRESEDYLEIAKNLSGTLLDSVTAGCQYLMQQGIIKKDPETNEYQYNYKIKSEF